MGILDEVRALYEKRPYPPVSLLTPFVQFLRRDDLPLLNYQAGFAASFGAILENLTPPRILIAGAGTFEPIAVAAANPGAHILAVDLSENSLQKLRWIAKVKRVKLETWRGDFQELPSSFGKFDYLIASGLIHHLEDPERGLKALKSLSHEQSVFRFMIYSAWGRDLLYGAKELATLLGVESPKALRRLLEALPADHPYRIYYHLYSDARTDIGLADGYLHPQDRAFTAEDLGRLLDICGIEATCFLQKFGANPENTNHLPASASQWSRMALLEAMGELEENFLFFAKGKGNIRYEADSWKWNPALPKRSSLYSKRIEKILPLGKIPERKEEYRDALFLLPSRRWA
jgi:hypothetical protein